MRARNPCSTRRARWPVLTSVAVAALLPAAAPAACDLARFGDPAPRSCARDAADCLPRYLPDELSTIARGAVSEWVGLAVNDGRATWRALDLDKREIVIVERYAGARLKNAPHGIAATPSEALHTRGEGREQVVDHVRRWPLAPARFEALACVAAGAWSADALPVLAVTDSASRFTLLLPDKAQVDAAPGRLAGAAARFDRMVDGFVKGRRAGTTLR